MDEPTVPKYQVRELANHEYDLLKNTAPFDQIGVPDPATTRALVAQLPDGKIIGFWFLHAALHVEPFGLDPDHRSPALAKKMWDGIRSMMEQSSARVAYGIIADEDLVTAGMARRLGFQRVPAGLYWVSTEPIEKPGNGHADFDLPPALKES